MILSLTSIWALLCRSEDKLEPCREWAPFICGSSSRRTQRGKMSADDVVAQARMMCCASCGKSELDDIRLKPCDDCNSVCYCSDSCRHDHRPEHELKCKEYQEAHKAAALCDEILFRQPESRHLGDCPICFLPLPVDLMQSIYYSCCSKMICNGCGHAHKLHQLQENGSILHVHSVATLYQDHRKKPKRIWWKELQRTIHSCYNKSERSI